MALVQGWQWDRVTISLPLSLVWVLGFHIPPQGQGLVVMVGAMLAGEEQSVREVT